jgi:glycine cleavage system H protein
MEGSNMSVSNLYFTKSHEWVRIEGDLAVVGITQHAQEELGDVALVQLPEPGRILQVDEVFGEVESIKAVSELYSPVQGEVAEANEELHAAPELVNNDPLGEGWMVKIRLHNPGDLDSLLDEAAYNDLVKEL